MWDLSLVDPDNRRPVDYDLRRPSLAQIRTGVMATDLLENWSDGRIKLLVTTRLLQFRRDHPTLFSNGEYLPENAEGSLAENVIAFRRRTPEAEILVVTPRFSSRVAFPPIGKKWGETTLPSELLGVWKDLFTGSITEFGNSLRIADLLRHLSVAVLDQAHLGTAVSHSALLLQLSPFPAGFGHEKKLLPMFPWEGAYFWRCPTFAQPIEALSSGLQRFTSVFGMGTGGATALGSPEV